MLNLGRISVDASAQHGFESHISMFSRFAQSIWLFQQKQVMLARNSQPDIKLTLMIATLSGAFIIID